MNSRWYERGGAIVETFNAEDGAAVHDEELAG